MKILTITINPALDKSANVQQVVPERKLRCTNPIYEPGGGGINVSRAIKRLGGDSCAWFTSGGTAGARVEELLVEEGISFKTIPISKGLRVNLTILETSTNLQYRFGMPGAMLEEHEWKKFLDHLEKEKCPEYIVMSGSTSPGVPDDFYAQAISICKAKNCKIIVDTSGEPLKLAVNEGVFMLKPNLKELAQLVNKEYVSAHDQERFARELVDSGKCQVLIVSLGARGLMYTTENEQKYLIPPTVEKQSVVGAGDSLVAGFVYSLSSGRSIQESIMYGLAAGAATTMTPGTELCKKEDADMIFDWIRSRQGI
jgi:6-phosphofructokinase 2